MIFDISDNVFLDNAKIKIIDGIAGAGKSSIIDDFFKQKSLSYMRCTSTNRLKRDAEKRYKIPCYTIASGLFRNENGAFYSTEKQAVDIGFQHVVIDEILQADIRIIKWLYHNIGKLNIVITTDTAQMLSPKSGKRFLKEFETLCKSEHVVYRCLTETKRARDIETQALYKVFYGKVNDDIPLPKSTLKDYKTINIKDMQFDPKDVYITHTRIIEDRLYRHFHIAMRDDIDRIPKAFLASRPPQDLTQYPCFSQLQAENTKSNRYTQASNIATPTRYQGSEVKTGQTLYYIITPKSRITAREFYTVFTRCWTKDSLVIVIDDTGEDETIKEFFNKPVKTEVLYNIQAEDEENLIINEDGSIDKKSIERIIKTKTPPEDHIFSEKAVVYDKEVRTIYPKKQKEKGRNAFTLTSLTDREEVFDYGFMGKVYRTLERHEIDRIKPIAYKNKDRDIFSYEIDLFSAFPTILCKEYLPIDGDFYLEESEELMNFYLYNGCIVTDIIKKVIPPFELEYLFSTDKQQGCKLGQKLYDMAHDTIETKAKVKKMNYGIWRWHYLEEHKAYDCYILHPDYTKELVMVAINSVLYALMIGLATITKEGYSKVDAWHYNNYSDTEEIKRYMKEEWPEFDYRIKDLTCYFIPEFARDFETVQNLTEDELEPRILYQTYDDLRTNAEKKKEQARERDRRRREKERRQRDDQRKKRFMYRDFHETAGEAEARIS